MLAYICLGLWGGIPGCITSGSCISLSLPFGKDDGMSVVYSPLFGYYLGITGCVYYFEMFEEFLLQGR